MHALILILASAHAYINVSCVVLPKPAPPVVTQTVKGNVVYKEITY